MTFFVEGTDIADLDTMKTIFFKYRSDATTNEYLIGSDGVDARRGWCLLILDNNLTFRNYHTASSYNELENATTIRDNSWHSIGLTVNSSTNVYTLYIDGSAVDSGTFTETHLIGNRLAVGLKQWRGNDYGLHSSTLFDSLRIYKTTKTATQISNLHNFQPNANEVPVTERGSSGLIGQATFGSSHMTQIPITPDTRLSTIQDISLNDNPSPRIGESLDYITPEVESELESIDIENIPIITLDTIKIDLNALGDIDIEPLNLDLGTSNIVDISDILNPESISITNFEIPTNDNFDIRVEQLTTPNIDSVIKPVEIKIIKPDPITVELPDSAGGSTNELEEPVYEPETALDTALRTSTHHARVLESGTIHINLLKYKYGTQADRNFKTISFRILKKNNVVPNLTIRGVLTRSRGLASPKNYQGIRGAYNPIDTYNLRRVNIFNAKCTNTHLNTVFGPIGKSRIPFITSRRIRTPNRKGTYLHSRKYPTGWALIPVMRTYNDMPYYVPRLQSASLSTGWHHIVIQFESTGHRLWLDGTLIGSRASAIPDGTVTRESIKKGISAIGGNVNGSVPQIYDTPTTERLNSRGEYASFNYNPLEPIQDVLPPVSLDRDPIGTKYRGFRYAEEFGGTKGVALKTITDYRNQFNDTCTISNMQVVMPDQWYITVGNDDSTQLENLMVHDISRFGTDSIADFVTELNSA